MLATQNSIRSHNDARDKRSQRSRLRKWDRMSRKGVDVVLKDCPDDFWRRVQHGIPQEHRFRIWKSSILSANSRPYGREAQEREAALFSGSPTASGCRASLLARESDWDKEIQRDVARTFTELASFTDEHEESLRRVLNAYAFLHPEVGYKEGMGFVVGTLLLTSSGSEQESLLLFVRLMQDCGMRNFYQGGRYMLKQYEHVFEQLLEELLPTLKSHFDSEEVQTRDYVRQWFLSLFTYCLPMETALLVWDIVMCKGLPHLVLVAVALLSSVEEVLLAKEHEEILEFFHSMNLAEDKMIDSEVGRCLCYKIARFSKMLPVQRLLDMLLDTAPETNESFSKAEVTEKSSNVGPTRESAKESPSSPKSPKSPKKCVETGKMNNKKNKRVSFSFDNSTLAAEGGPSSSISWYFQ